MKTKLIAQRQLRYGDIFRLGKPRSIVWPDRLISEVRNGLVKVRNYHTESGAVGPTTSYHRTEKFRNEEYLGTLTKKTCNAIFFTKK